MKWTDIREKPKDRLDKDLADARARLVDLRFKAQSGALKQVHQFKDAKKDVSRLLTRMHQLEHTDTSQKADAPDTDKAGSK